MVAATRESCYGPQKSTRPRCFTRSSLRRRSTGCLQPVCEVQESVSAVGKLCVLIPVAAPRRLGGPTFISLRLCVLASLRFVFILHHRGAEYFRNAKARSRKVAKVGRTGFFVFAALRRCVFAFCFYSSTPGCGVFFLTQSRGGARSQRLRGLDFFSALNVNLFSA